MCFLNWDKYHNSVHIFSECCMNEPNVFFLNIKSKRWSESYVLIHFVYLGWNIVWSSADHKFIALKQRNSCILLHLVLTCLTTIHTGNICLFIPALFCFPFYFFCDFFNFLPFLHLPFLLPFLCRPSSSLHIPNRYFIYAKITNFLKNKTSNKVSWEIWSQQKHQCFSFS